MRTLRLAWLLSRPSGSGAATTVLPVVAFGVVTTLLLGVIGGMMAFFSFRGETAGVYQILAVVATVLLVVPLLALGGSAARLSARRRDDRLSSLRLLGATPALVGALTVIESTVLAIAGAIVGVLGYLATAPLIGLIQFRGAPLGGAIWLAPWIVVIVVAAVAILAALSAVVGLQGVVVSPLGVRTKQVAPGIHWVRVLIGAIVVLLAVGAMSALQLGAIIIIPLIVLAVVFGGTLAILGLVGPFVLRLMAKRQARVAKTAQRLLAARSILESPKAAWRQVSGVAMTSFMAVVAGSAIAIFGAAASDSSVDADGRLLAIDVRTGVIVTLIASFLMVACSVGVNQASGILDRRELYVSLDRVGMPVETMDAARRRAVMSPLRIVALGSALIAAVVVLPLTGIALIVAPASLLVIAGCFAVGIGLVWLGLRATKPVLTRVLAQPERVG